MSGGTTRTRPTTPQKSPRKAGSCHQDRRHQEAPPLPLSARTRPRRNRGALGPIRPDRTAGPWETAAAPSGFRTLPGRRHSWPLATLRPWPPGRARPSTLPRPLPRPWARFCPFQAVPPASWNPGPPSPAPVPGAPGASVSACPAFRPALPAPAAPPPPAEPLPEGDGHAVAVRGNPLKYSPDQKVAMRIIM